MPSSQFTHTSPVARPPSDVWTALQYPATWKAIGGIDAIDGARHDDGGNLLGFEFTTSVAGKPYRGTATTVTSTPGESMEMSVDTSELKATIAVRIVEDQPHTILDVAMNLSAKGVLASLMWGIISPAVGNNMPARVEGVAAAIADGG